MRGGFDLYGNYYPNMNDALNAEMSQCNEIDNRINNQRIKKLEQKQYYEPQSDLIDMWQYIDMLEKRIKQLEDLTGRMEK